MNEIPRLVTKIKPPSRNWSVLEEEPRDWWRVQGGGRRETVYRDAGSWNPFPTTNLYVISCDSQVPGLSGFLRRHDSLTFPLLIGRELRL